MSTRLKIKFVVEIEYEAKPEYYPDSSRTPEGMLAIDLASANNDPLLMIGSDAEWKITGEILK